MALSFECPELSSFLNKHAAKLEAYRMASQSLGMCRWLIHVNETERWGVEDWHKARVLVTPAGVSVDEKLAWNVSGRCSTCSKWFDKKSATSITDTLSLDDCSGFPLKKSTLIDIARQFSQLLVIGDYAVVTRLV